MDWEKPDKAVVSLRTGKLAQMSKVERIKAESRGLFLVTQGHSGSHPFAEEIDALSEGRESTVSDEAKELSKFFGSYKQQARGERGRKTDDYFFMVRIKNPAGGELRAKQWVALDEAADRFGDGTLRVTSRQGLQYHHVYGRDLAPLVRHLNRHYREGATLGACGDVNRNTMTSPLDGLDPGADPRAQELAFIIAEELAPRSSAYFQIFLSDDEGQRSRPLQPDEPFYGEQYLPRKFKVCLAHPRDNSVDLLTHDVGLMPITVDGSCDGSLWDLYSGGGLGLTHNNRHTAALLGLYLGRIRRDQVLDAVRALATMQRDHGERRDRRLARWKYTLRRLGLEMVKRELREQFGIALEEADPAPLPPVELHLGWHEVRDGEGFYGLSIQNGRIDRNTRKAIRASVERLGLGVRLTPHQDVLLCGVRERRALEQILESHGVRPPEEISRVRRYAMACPAKPTCGLAMTEAERILPAYVDAIEAAGLGDVDVEIRMTGCPNNCARPPTAEIGIYGYGKNDHVILVGGSRCGSRVAKTLYSRVPEEQMAPILVGLLRAVREHKREGLSVGDFLHQTEPVELRRWVGVEERDA